jgi:hypothetical protein
MFTLYVMREEAGATWKLREEYDRVRARVPEGSRLNMGGRESDAGGGMRYDALLLLSGELPTVEEVDCWFNLGGPGVFWGPWRVKEPSKSRVLGQWVQQAQSDVCVRSNGETFGEWIVFKREEEAYHAVVRHQMEPISREPWRVSGREWSTTV